MDLGAGALGRRQGKTNTGKPLYGNLGKALGGVSLFPATVCLLHYYHHTNW